MTNHDTVTDPGPDTRLRQLAGLFVEVGGRLHTAAKVDDVLALIAETAVQACPGAEFAGVSRQEKGGFRTVGETGELALKVDAIQYELRSGPCVDAVLEQTLFRTDDLRSESRWPEFSRRTVEATGVTSMLAFRMFFESSTLIAGLNLYSTAPRAFDEADEATVLLLSTHGAQALAGIGWQNEVETLEHALSSNRDIGVAMGILMSRYLVTRDEAFGLLRMASQHEHRKLAVVAREVAETGALELPSGNGPDRDGRAAG